MLSGDWKSPQRDKLRLPMEAELDGFWYDPSR
jgi:hypothetical protein